MRETRTAQASIFDFYSKHERSVFFANLSAKLDQHPELLTLIESDLLTQGTKPTGRKGLSVESIFRCLLLKQITGASYDSPEWIVIVLWANQPCVQTFVEYSRKHCKLCLNFWR